MLVDINILSLSLPVLTDQLWWSLVHVDAWSRCLKRWSSWNVDSWTVEFGVWVEGHILLVGIIWVDRHGWQVEGGWDRWGELDTTVKLSQKDFRGESHLIFQSSLCHVSNTNSSLVLLQNVENTFHGNVRACAYLLKLISLLIEHGDVDLKLTKLRKLLNFLHNIFGAFAFGIPHFDWVGDGFEVDNI